MTQALATSVAAARPRTAALTPSRMALLKWLNRDSIAGRWKPTVIPAKNNTCQRKANCEKSIQAPALANATTAHNPLRNNHNARGAMSMKIT